MDAETDLFVQAFWVKCRDVVRPELDQAVDALRSAGHEANISTQEFSPDKKDLPEGSPELVLTIHPAGSAARELRYRGDVPARELDEQKDHLKDFSTLMSILASAATTIYLVGQSAK